MKRILLLAVLALSFAATAQTVNPKYDRDLAESLGADEYGMKQYVFVILKTGPNKVDDQAKLNTIFRGHMENIQRLAKEGKLVVAGPFMKNDNGYRGIFIFNVKTLPEAQALLEGDPAVKEKILEAEMYEWYVSAELG